MVKGGQELPPHISSQARELVKLQPEKPDALDSNKRLSFAEQMEAAEVQKEEKELAERRLAETGLAKLRDTLGSDLMKETTVFASTALYLMGKIKQERGEPDWKRFDTPPGDVDFIVDSQEGLEKIRSRLLQTEGAKLDGIKYQEGDDIPEGFKAGDTIPGTEGTFTSLPGQPDTRRLGGKMEVEYETIEDGQIVKKKGEYDFEFFLNSQKIVSDRDRQDPVTYHGVRILGPDALMRQYKAVLGHETRVDREVSRVMKLLNSQKLRPLREALQRGEEITNSEQLRDVLQRNATPEQTEALLEYLDNLELTIEDIADVYGRASDIEKLSDAGESEKAMQAGSEQATQVSGYKTKLYKRVRNIEKLSEQAPDTVAFLTAGDLEPFRDAIAAGAKIESTDDLISILAKDGISEERAGEIAERISSLRLTKTEFENFYKRHPRTFETKRAAPTAAEMRRQERAEKYQEVNTDVLSAEAQERQEMLKNNAEFLLDTSLLPFRAAIESGRPLESADDALALFTEAGIDEESAQAALDKIAQLGLKRSELEAFYRSNPAQEEVEHALAAK